MIGREAIGDLIVFALQLLGAAVFGFGCFFLRPLAGYLNTVWELSAVTAPLVVSMISCSREYVEVEMVFLAGNSRFRICSFCLHFGIIVFWPSSSCWSFYLVQKVAGSP